MSSSRELSTFWQSVAADLGVPVNGLAFIYDAFDYMREKRGQTKTEPRHCSAADYCDAVVQLAKHIFGEDYVSALKSWGLDTSEKVGCVIFKLVDRGLIDRQESDRESDFHDQFDFSLISAPVMEFVPYQRQPKSDISPRWKRVRRAALQLVFVPIGIGFFFLAVKLADIFKPIPVIVFLGAFVFAYLLIDSLLRKDIRYSLRSLLIGMTLVAVALGVVAMFS
jgi:uncharacterized repeat protein (TIGR04138 family)